MIADILSSLARANIAGAIGVVLVLATRRPVRRRFGPGAAYALWALPVVAALAALLPQGQFASPVDAVTFALADRAGLLAPKARAVPWPQVLLAVWLAGAAGAAAVLLGRQARFVGAMGRLTPVGPGERSYRSTREGVGPAVVGVIEPRIVTPSDFEQRFSDEERALILAHERAHLRRGDPRANAVASLAQCLAWFNPLAHLAVRLMRVDQELACDAEVLRERPTARRRYAEVLLKTQLSVRPLPLGCLWPAAAEHPLKLRIAILAAPTPDAGRRALGLALIAGLVICGGLAAWAAQPTATSDGVLRRPEWIEKPRAADLPNVYPKDAARRNLAGAATIGCRVDRAGRLRACHLVGETPAGAGFGDAALSLTPLFRMQASDGNGMPTAGHAVRIPVKFRPGCLAGAC